MICSPYPLLLGLAGLAGLAAMPALAQAPAAAPPSAATPVAPPAASAPGAAAETNKDDKSAIKALRADCREQAKAQRLKGEAKRAAVSACVVKARPELAGLEQCRGEARAKGLRGKELHAAVRECARSKG